VIASDGKVSRTRIKRALAPLATGRPRGATVLIYHRVGGGTPDERDCPADAFAAQMRALAAHHEVVSLDAALDGLSRGNTRPRVVVTFDDGFADLHTTAWPILAEHDLPFTVYLATGYLDGTMHWEGSTASERQCTGDPPAAPIEGSSGDERTVEHRYECPVTVVRRRPVPGWPPLVVGQQRPEEQDGDTGGR
jgi:hypothetical protein